MKKSILLLVLAMLFLCGCVPIAVVPSDTPDGVLTASNREIGMIYPDDSWLSYSSAEGLDFIWMGSDEEATIGIVRFDYDPGETLDLEDADVMADMLVETMLGEIEVDRFELREMGGRTVVWMECSEKLHEGVQYPEKALEYITSELHFRVNVFFQVRGKMFRFACHSYGEEGKAALLKCLESIVTTAK